MHKPTRSRGGARGRRDCKNATQSKRPWIDKVFILRVTVYSNRPRERGHAHAACRSPLATPTQAPTHRCRPTFLYCSSAKPLRRSSRSPPEDHCCSPLGPSFGSNRFRSIQRFPSKPCYRPHRPPVSPGFDRIQLRLEKGFMEYQFVVFHGVQAFGTKVFDSHRVGRPLRWNLVEACIGLTPYLSKAAKRLH